MNTRPRGTVIRVLVIVVVLIAALALVRRIPDPETTASPTSTPSAATSTPVPSTTASAPVVSPSPAPTTSPTVAAWHKTATAFVTAYSTTAGGQAAWLARLRPLVSAEVYRGFTYTDVSNLPGGTPRAGRVLTEDTYAGGTMRFPLAGSSVWGIDVSVSLGSDGREVVTRVMPAASDEAAP